MNLARTNNCTTLPLNPKNDDDQCPIAETTADSPASQPLYPATSYRQRQHPDNNYESTSSACHCHQSSRQKRKSYRGLGRIRFGKTYPCMVFLSVIVYWTFVSLVPIYNKFFFQKTLYPYPIATAGIQLGVVSLLLALWNVFNHFFMGRHSRLQYQKYHQQYSVSRATSNDCVSSHDDNKTSGDSCSCCYHPNSSPPSWIFGPHFWWKLRWCFPIGTLFGLKYAVTNLGLHLVPAPTHLLLQSTDLVWTVLSAWWINGESVALVEMICLSGCVGGSVVLGWQLNSESTMTAPLYAIAVNLISPILLGLCLATLRLACTELMRPDNRVGGTVSSVELTSVKLMVSSVVGLIMACLMEGGDETKQPWWGAFIDLTKSTQWGVMGGALLISVFQVNCTFLTFLTSAVALGLVGQVKIVPQWLLAFISSSRSSNFQFHAMNLVGAALIMGSATAFALFNWVKFFTMVESHPDESDEERGTDTDFVHEMEADISEGKPLLLFSDANDFGAAVVRKNYFTMEETMEYQGSDEEDEATEDIALVTNHH
ncbi:hypothetical protein IV203_010222 [Nitzschia inconspicua]|uniref:Uncharacterized protein n=1 Tax=Nitzschia inconspicua TaxID=303405 RepID=A0A9K3PKA4_9STRA|nr:hypothetical protein IV203_010222 [Nitzschia inconspicua]